ncbi:hypothetical protein Vafri_1619 [Volvox africanus]|nr:hypothetical protein Vafri_1619 [Volvox africanus]
MSNQARECRRPVPGTGRVCVCLDGRITLQEETRILPRGGGTTSGAPMGDSALSEQTALRPGPAHASLPHMSCEPPIHRPCNPREAACLHRHLPAKNNVIVRLCFSMRGCSGLISTPNCFNKPGDRYTGITTSWRQEGGGEGKHKKIRWLREETKMKMMCGRGT